MKRRVQEVLDLVESATDGDYLSLVAEDNWLADDFDPLMLVYMLQMAYWTGFKAAAAAAHQDSIVLQNEAKDALHRNRYYAPSKMTALRLLLAEPGGHFNLTEDFSAIHFAVAWHAYVDARNKAARHLWFSKRQMCYASRQLTPEEDAEMAQIPCRIAEALSKIHPNVVVTDDGDIRAHTVYFSLPSGAGNTFPTGRIVMD